VRDNTATDKIRPAMILWGGGIAAGMIETITPATLGNRKTWRITHYPEDPAANKVNDYDMYDLDRTTLAPLRSVMNTGEFHLELIFHEKEVTFHKTSHRENVVERIPLSTGVEPEGPGLELFLASLPLAVGYQKRYAIVDRWGGHGGTRLKMVTLSVPKRTTEYTSLGKRDIYDVLIKTDDGKTYPASEVSAIVSQGW
jgi:hypothetical protein